MSAEKSTSMNIRMNKEVKLQAQKVFADLGIDLTTAVNVFLRQAIRYQGFPFEVTLRGGEAPNATTMATIDYTEKGIDMHGPFESVTALMEDLNAED